MSLSKRIHHPSPPKKLQRTSYSIMANFRSRNTPHPDSCGARGWPCFWADTDSGNRAVMRGGNRQRDGKRKIYHERNSVSRWNMTNRMEKRQQTEAAWRCLSSWGRGEGCLIWGERPYLVSKTGSRMERPKPGKAHDTGTAATGKRERRRRRRRRELRWKEKQLAKGDPGFSPLCNRR